MPDTEKKTIIELDAYEASILAFALAYAIAGLHGEAEMPLRKDFTGTPEVDRALATMTAMLGSVQ